MITIIDIEKSSIADELGIRVGDRLICINGKPVHDALDYRFYSAGEELEVLIEQNGHQIIFEIDKEYQEDIGIVLEDLKMRKCGNKCVFCFVNQNPKGLRKTLYFKDEDYRFSFLYGHYVTLSHVAKNDLKRIIEQRLTPLYVSVHITEPQLRKYILGIKFDDRLLKKIDYLTQNGIEIHCQIVLCPGLNDGKYLYQTITDLKKFYPAVRSIAIVPVGLTKHRKNLPIIKPVTTQYSLPLIDEISNVRENLKKEIGSPFVYLSDEFFIRTNVKLPKNEYYEGFYQLENGVGLTRDLINRMNGEMNRLLKNELDVCLTFVSGILGIMALEKYFLPSLKRVPNLRFSLYPITNYFYGDSIEVAGLLVGQDIYDQLKRKELGEYIVLPPRVLNHDSVFLDDWTVERLERKLKRKILVFPDSFLKLFENIKAEREVKSEDLARRIRHTGPSLYVSEQMISKEMGFIPSS